MTKDNVARWLHDQRGDNNVPKTPEELADEFPLSTIPSPPSSTISEGSAIEGEDLRRSGGLAPSDTRKLGIQQLAGGDNSRRKRSRREEYNSTYHPHSRDNLIHPPAPSMEDTSTLPPNNARRRSTSLVGAGVPGSSKHARRHRRGASEHIPEEGEDISDSASDESEKSDSEDLELDDMRSSDGLEDDEETGLTGRDRRRRRKKKRRNTLLDQRVVPDGGGLGLTKEEERKADQTLLRSMLVNGILIGLWYDNPAPNRIPSKD